MVDIPKIELINGNSIPLIGLGTWRLSGEKGVNSIREAIDLGYRHFDTAEMYKNEEEIGRAVRESGVNRNDFFITSKIWPDHLGYDGVIRALNGSLERLGMSYLDLYLVHWPNVGMDLEGTFKAFKELIDKGRVLSIGVSNFSVVNLDEAISISKRFGVKIAVNQAEFNPSHYDEELVNYCKKNNIFVVAYSPFNKGRDLNLEFIKKIADKHGKNPSQIILRWILYEGVGAIPKASSLEHLSENLGVFDFDLNIDDVEIIRENSRVE